MRKPLTRIAAVVLGGLLAATTVLPLSVAAAANADDVQMQDEAWFFKYRQPLAPVPDIDDPTGNQPDDIGKATVRERTNPYQPATLHVGVNSGDPEAITYFSFPLLDLGGTGLDAILTGGTVTFTDAADQCKNAAGANTSCGSRRADASEMVACRATDLIVQADGGDWASRYPYDEGDCAPLELVKGSGEGEKPLQWTLDLTPFVPGWKPPAINHGLAIVPNPKSERPPPDQTWHVAFHAASFNTEDVEHRPITADLQFEKQELEIPEFDVPDFSAPAAPAGGGFDSGGGGFEAGGGDFGTADPGFTGGDVGVAAPPAGPPIAAGEAQTDAVGPAPVAAAPQTAPAAAEGAQTNPAIWLLPLLGITLAGVLTWSLNAPVELTGQREGAVSRLMRNRRLGSVSSATDG